MNNSLNPITTTSTFDNDHAFLFGNEFEPDIQDPQSDIESSDTIDSSSSNDSRKRGENSSTIKRSLAGQRSANNQNEGVREAASDDDDDEDNNPFKGSNHIYAKGIHNSINKNHVHRTPNVSNDIIEHSTSLSTGGRQLRSTNPTQKLPNSISYIKMPAISKKEVEILSMPSKSISGFDSEVSDDYSRNFNRFGYIKDDELMIKIVYAGKFQFSDGKVAIGYTIAYDGKRVTRRYTDFVKLRQTLKKLLPTCIIPPIPDRHSLMSYILQPFQFSLNYNRNNGSKRLIDESNETLLRRSRQFQKFLNICISKPKIKNCSTFSKFIDPEFAHWGKVMAQPPINILPETNLLAPPLDPVKPSPLHLLLPLPKQIPPLSEEDEEMISWLENYNKTYIQPSLRVFNNFRSHMESCIEYIAELGGIYNVSSIETQIFIIQQNLTEEEYDSQNHSMNSSFGSIHDRRFSIDNKNNNDDDLSNVLEKVGQIYDSNYVSTQFLVNDLSISFKESLEMLLKFNEETLSLINFKNLKREQNCIIVNNLKQLQDRHDLLESLKRIDSAESVAVEENIESGNEADSSINRSVTEELQSETDNEVTHNEDDISVDSILASKNKNDYIESVLMKNKGNSKAIQSAIKQYTLQKRQSTYKKIIKDLPKKQEENDRVGSSEVVIKSPTISREKINEEIQELNKKINNVKILNDLSDKDNSEIDSEFASELNFEKELYGKIWSKDIIANLKTSIVAWSNENLAQWENLLSEFSCDE